MNFAQVEQQISKLRQELETGRLTEEECKAQMRELMVEDEQGNWWMVGYETGEWYRHDGDDWGRADPPGYIAPEQTPPSVAPPTPVPSRPVSKPVTQAAVPAKPKSRPLKGIVVFVLTEAVIVAVGFGIGLVVAALFYDGMDNPFSWICWIGASLGGLVISYRSARKAWRGE